MITSLFKNMSEKHYETSLFGNSGVIDAGAKKSTVNQSCSNLHALS
ncbi:hypothetical protein IMCC3135_31595 [Granulosicoccus antarcticus IMCC3135]|uniref:Uncharacterized protein n=1 Tax=Granulosicoccus antarcticus IMCC3135 TaxID=1192854 RepID=A0A2Z2NY38_9GAMM|nr:hypothetical protein IMCC3135_31595 [Granulosicoccus antarcticus IMCC3135]